MLTSRPRHLRTCMTFPNSMVGLPFSSSDIKRIPTPHSEANSACVAPCALRWARTHRPRSLVPIIIPYGSFSLRFTHGCPYFSRSGNIIRKRLPGNINSPVRDFFEGCRSRILMQPSEDRHDAGHGRPEIPQRRRVPPLVSDVHAARRHSRTGVFATEGSNRDTAT